MTFEGHERGEEERSIWGLQLTCTSLSLCHSGSPAIVLVGFSFFKKIKFKSLNYFYRNTTRDLGTAQGLNCGENGGGGGWMGLIMSLEGGGMCSLCFGHLLHSTSPCFI